MLGKFGKQIPLLPATVITTAAAGVTPAASVITNLGGMKYLAVEAILTYGSGGTSIDCYIQTSLDGGVTWIDIMEFSFTTASAKKVSAVSANIALAAAVTPGDAALTANTILNGLLGDRIRLKYTSVGTYAASTTLAVSAVAKAA